MLRRFSAAALLTALLTALPTAVWAQDPGQFAVNDAGDTAWMLGASALVLLLSIPALGLYYSSQADRKNVLSIWIQLGIVAAVTALLWVVVGYTLAFGQVSLQGWLGGGRAWMLNNLGSLREGTAIPESTFVLFQMALAMFAAALMIGAWIGRARLAWVIGFSALWVLIVYAPVAHWIWGGGFLASRFGTLDFAGGIVIHVSAGVSALVVSLMLGRRLGFPDRIAPAHSPVIAIAGAAMLCTGWLGISGGSAFAATDDASAAIINTMLAASVAALTWAAIEKFSSGRITGGGWANGSLAGLVASSAATGFISPGAAIVLGTVAVVICYAVSRFLHDHLKIDDGLNVFTTHAVAGALGAVMLAAFLSESLGGVGYPDGISMLRQLAAQGIGVAAVAIWSAVASAVLALMVSLFIQMRVSEDEEIGGLDITGHGDRAWEFD